MSNTNSQDVITDEARTALITAIGIILAFTLGFFGQWSLASDETPWERYEILVLIVMCIGIALNIIALYLSLELTQTRKFYKRTVAIFTAGISLSFISALLAVLL
jgi:hypothetical protein